jgi:hypothetical protein
VQVLFNIILKYSSVYYGKRGEGRRQGDKERRREGEEKRGR